ncbi:MAG: extracellular solute-binding protein, partial [Acidimicrobiales bacterium]
AKNKAAMLTWQNPMSTLAQLGMSASSYGIAPIPMPATTPAGGKPVETFPAGINLAVPSSTKHKAAALQLVKFMTSPAVQAKVNQTYGTFPPVLAAQKTSAFQTPAEKTLEGIYNNHAAPLPRVPSESTMETDLGGAITHLIAKAATGGSVSTSEILSALKSAQDQLNAAAGASAG